MDIAGEIRATSVGGKGARSIFNVLLEDGAPAELGSFLDQYLGEWARVQTVAGASMQVLVPRGDSRFRPQDVEWANALFDRDETEARVYEFDRFENRLIARLRENINSRKGLS